MYLKRGCTAAKVAPKKLLTAAHCVLDPSTLDLLYGPGKPVFVTREPAAGDEAYAEHEVVKVDVHPAWKAACESSYCASSAVTALLDAPDIAVIELADDLPGVPAAPIDVTPLAAKARVVVLGFGLHRGRARRRRADDAFVEVGRDVAHRTVACGPHRQSGRCGGASSRREHLCDDATRGATQASAPATRAGRSTVVYRRARSPSSA